MCGIEPYGRMPSSGNPGPGYIRYYLLLGQPEGFGSIKLLALYRVDEPSPETTCNRTLLIVTDYHS